MRIITAANVYKSYSLNAQNDTPVLKNVSIDVEQGEFLAVVGPSGAGKSTLLHLLGTLDKPDRGHIELRLNNTNHVYSSMSKAELATLRNTSIGFIFQFHHLLPEFTAVENVMMPALIAGTTFKQAEQKAANLMELVGMNHRKEHKPSELSGGEQQRIAIARALINSPTVLFADEPTGNLDSANTEGVLKLLDSIRARYSLTMVIATHSTEVAAAAQRIVSMRDGSIQ